MKQKQIFLHGLQVVWWSCSYFCLTSWILSWWSSSSGWSWACCLASCSMAVCWKRRIWLEFMQTICQCRAAVRQRIDCKMIQLAKGSWSKMEFKVHQSDVHHLWTPDTYSTQSLKAIHPAEEIRKTTGSPATFWWKRGTATNNNCTSNDMTT